MSDSSIWILRAGVNDDVCGTFSSREKAEKQGSFLQSCGELSGYTVTEYVPSSEIASLRESLKDLSKRIRPNVEAAPWVVASITALL